MAKKSKSSILKHRSATLKAKNKELKAQEKLLKKLYKQESRLLEAFIKEHELNMWDEINEYLEEYSKMRQKEIVKQRFNEDLEKILEEDHE